jgi:RNA polymerase sigma factor (sigma-70 family)
VIIPEGQLAEILPDGLVDALERGPALDPQWTAARDAFIASVGAEWGGEILKELLRLIARRHDTAQESAQDLFQKVMLVLTRRYGEHVKATGTAWAPVKPKAYIHSVCRNVARNHFKAKGRRPAIERGVEVDETRDAAPDPEEAVSDAQLLAIFERERRNLPEAEVEVFEGRASLGMSFPAIAALLGRPVSTVQTQYARAVARLRAILAGA